MARVLREVMAAMRTSADFERIGDHVSNVAENVWFIEHGERVMSEREKRDHRKALIPTC